MVLVNPEIVRAAGAAVADEGCLSLPNWYGPVRASHRRDGEGSGP